MIQWPKVCKLHFNIVTSMFLRGARILIHVITNAPPNSLKDSNASLKVKITKKEKVSGTFFNSQHFGGKKDVLGFRDENYEE